MWGVKKLKFRHWFKALKLGIREVEFLRRCFQMWQQLFVVRFTVSIKIETNLPIDFIFRKYSKACLFNNTFFYFMFFCLITSNLLSNPFHWLTLFKLKQSSLITLILWQTFKLFLTILYERAQLEQCLHSSSHICMARSVVLFL